MGFGMADEIEETASTTTIVVPDVNREAQIILDWDDGQWYVSSIQNVDSSIDPVGTDTTTVDTTSGVKVAEWNKDYKYNENDIVGSNGLLYVSQQNQNQGNDPVDGTFWWNPVVDLTNVDAVTLEGANLSEIIRQVLGGNVITDYYKKTEIDSINLTNLNNVNAKKLADWTLTQIQEDYISKIAASQSSSKTDAIEYFTNEDVNGYQQALIDEFSDLIADDNVNKF